MSDRLAANDKSQVQVIARAATILRALEAENAGLSLGQIAQRVSLARSTVQRIVAALQTEKLVIAATPNGRVRLGPTILRLAASVRSDFLALARPFLERLSEELHETVDLAMVQEGPPDLHRPGDRLAAPAHGVGGGRDLSALLHRQRQGLSGAALRRRGREADRRASTRRARPTRSRGSTRCSRSSRPRGATASPSTARSTRSASAPPASRCSDPLGNAGGDLGAGAEPALRGTAGADRRAAARDQAGAGGADEFRRTRA